MRGCWLPVFQDATPTPPTPGCPYQGVELKPSGHLGPSSWDEVDEPWGCTGRGQDEKQIFTEDVERKPEGQAATSWARSSKENMTGRPCAGPVSLGGLARAMGGGPALWSRAMGSPGGGLSCWGAQTGSRGPGSVAAVPRLQGERSVAAAHRLGCCVACGTFLDLGLGSPMTVVLTQTHTDTHRLMHTPYTDTHPRRFLAPATDTAQSPCVCSWSPASAPAKRGTAPRIWAGEAQGEPVRPGRGRSGSLRPREVALLPTVDAGASCHLPVGLCHPYKSVGPRGRRAGGIWGGGVLGTHPGPPSTAS